MRKIGYCILLSIIFVAITVGVFSACDLTPNENESKTYEIAFSAQIGGKISGKRLQTVKEGECTQQVTAVADNGYYFVGWADLTDVNNDETVTENERIVDNIRSDRSFLAMFERKTFQIQYVSGDNGSIQGELTQSGKYGDDASTVIAIPNAGYYFVGWSDGMTEPTRKELFDENKTLVAIFKAITNTYTYNYKFADSNCDIESISLTYGQLDGTVFVVPKREHGTFAGWYADKYLTKQVADESGNIVIGNELFDSNGTQLYAKWVTENTAVYKILIVYVTKLNAEFTTKDGNGKIQVNYNMTNVERQICQMLTEKISFELNDLAVADFQIDEYFTSVPLTKENIKETHPINSTVDHKVYAYDIPEVQELLGEYDSVLVSYSMDDYFGDLHNSAGEASGKYGSINFDGKLTQLIYYNEPIENLLDPLHYYWDIMLETYLHEFAHTIELCVNNIFEYHKVDSEYLWDSVSDPLIAEKLYFLNRAVVNGQQVGVPYEYWKGNVFEVYYESTDGGTVHSEDRLFIYVLGHVGHTQYVLYGDDARSVIAEPKDGYEFVGWSDGIETAVRQDLNIIQDLHVYAIFKLKE